MKGIADFQKTRINLQNLQTSRGKSMLSYQDLSKRKISVVRILVCLLFLITSLSFSQIFDFDNGTLQGWTMQGIYAYNTYPTVYNNPFTLTWDDATQYPGSSGNDPAGNSMGSASVYASNFTLPSNFSSGASYWLIDIVSPDVTSNQQWQDLTGISLNIHAAGFHSGECSAQILINATRKSDAQEVWLQEYVSGQGVFHSLTNGWNHIDADHFVNLSNYTINRVRVRVFGDPDITGSMREINIDNVTAISGSAGAGLSGTVLAYMVGEGGNGLDFSYDSYFTQYHRLTGARIDFTGTNVTIDYLGSMAVPHSPEVSDVRKISDKILEVDFTNFSSGKVVSVGVDLDIGASGSPYGSTYEGAAVEITFTGISCDMPLTGTFEETGTFSAQAVFSCGGESDVAPPPPSNLVATVVTSTQIDLAWDDNSDNETGFKIERKAGSSGTYQTIHTTLADQESYSDKDVQINTSYSYRVFAFNNTGASTYSNQDNVTTEDYGTYIDEFDLFPAYPYNTSDYKQGGAFVGCGPTSGAMILGYFDHIYNLSAPDGLLTDPDQGADEGLNTAWALHGNEYMKTNSDGFGSPYDIKPGLEGYAEARGYALEVMIHVSPIYVPGGDYSWNNYGDYGDAWINDGAFWQENPGGDWEIDVEKFCDFADSVFALNIPLFLTIDTDMDQGGDHWVPMVGYDRSSEKYAYYDTYSQTLQWADIHYVNAIGPLHDNSIVMVRTVGYEMDENLPAVPTNLVARLIPEQVHLTWEDHSDNETGFIIERKMSPGFPSVWSKIDTLDANTTSYQTGVPSIFNQTFYFRVLAFNEYGNSAYSNPDTVRGGLFLVSITLKSPNGGEEWASGSTHDITWSSFSSIIAYQIHEVTIRYSTDGGSHWVDPPIASNIENTGSYAWTVPNIECDQCLIKIEDASDGSPYDLSNEPFRIGEPVTPVLSVQPDHLEFGSSLNELNFQISNTGGGTLSWDVAETPDKLWMADIDPSAGNGDATISVQIDRSQLIGDSDTGLLKITSNAGNQEVTVSVTKEQGNLPEEWSYTETGNNATVVLPAEANPNIDGNSLLNGDYIGAFTPAGLCCGYAQWQETNLSLTVWGDDSQTNEIDGFQPGEIISYRVYRLSEAKSWNTVTVAYSQGAGTYAADAFIVLSQFDAADISERTVTLEEGWNMFSFNIDPVYSHIDSVMRDIKEKIVIIKDGDGNTYVPAYGINNIGDMDYRKGYKGYLNEASDLVVRGQCIDPSTPINLESGWSMVGYLPETPMDAAQALTSISDALVIAKNEEGKTYIPSFGINTIGDMEPGKGYKLYVRNEATLVYPDGSGGLPKAGIASRYISESDGMKDMQHFQFTDNTGQNCTVVVPTAIEPKCGDGTLLESGDEIGVFNSAGLCCGAIVWNGENAAITIWGDNTQTADTIDGFLENDTLRFRIWDNSEETEYAARACFENESSTVYRSDGYGVLTELTAEIGTGIENIPISTIPEKFSLNQNYPNPFNPETAIEFHLPKQAEVILTIYDMTGREVYCLFRKTMSAGIHTAHWAGIHQNGRLMASGMYFYRIVAHPDDGSDKKWIQVRKMIFMK
ncbi:T9SS type A sorting domain-containing protein [bacterium]|nr:T9SS type A sorting domain-containing protein [bacterium]RQV97973.1 MAG: T9SS C-terminal target domain-containing protein [bacterium]